MKTTITTAAWILTVFLLVVMLNCSDEETVVVVQPAKQVIMPLKIGNTWTYVDSLNNGSAWTEFSSQLSVTGKSIVAVDTFTYEAYDCVMVDSFQNDPATLHLWNDDLDGLWQYGVTCSADSVRFAFMMAPYPTRPGRTYTSIFGMLCAMGNPIGIGPGQGECTHTDTMYVTPAGTFACYRYHQHYDMPIFGIVDVFLYMTPGVGMVGHEYYGDTGTWIKRLSKYSLQ